MAHEPEYPLVELGIPHVRDRAPREVRDARREPTIMSSSCVLCAARRAPRAGNIFP